MNILQVHKYFWPRDGASKYMLDLSSILGKQNHVVIPFSTKHPQNLPTPFESYFIPSIDIHEPEKMRFSEKVHGVKTMLWSKEAAKEMKRLLQDQSVHVAHLHNIYHHISPSILPVLADKKIPVVMTVHDYALLSPNYTLFHHGQIHEEEMMGWYVRAILNKSIKNSRLYSAICVAEMILHHKMLRVYEKNIDVLICPSLFSYELFRRMGWNPEKLVHIPHPVDAHGFPDMTTEDNGTVVYSGRLSEEKGLETLFAAASATPEIPYVICGDGPMRQALEKRAEDLHIRNVTFAGFLSGLELYRVIGSARFVVVPSVWYENYPLAILEAKAMGKVVIGSAIGGIPEMIPAHMAAPAGNATVLAETIRYWFNAKREEREKIGAANREEVMRENDPVAHGIKIEEVYQNLV